MTTQRQIRKRSSINGKGCMSTRLVVDWTDKLFALQCPRRKAMKKVKQYEEIDVNKYIKLQEMEYDE